MQRWPAISIRPPQLRIWHAGRRGKLNRRQPYNILARLQASAFFSIRTPSNAACSSPSTSPRTCVLQRDLQSQALETLQVRLRQHGDHIRRRQPQLALLPSASHPAKCRCCGREFQVSNPSLLSPQRSAHPTSGFRRYPPAQPSSIAHAQCPDASADSP